MKKLLALLMAVMMVTGVFVSCGAESTTKSAETTVENDKKPSPSENKPAPSPVPSKKPSPSEPEIKLPSAATLKGTKHLPIVDNQGGIGCCTAEAVTYAQFTVAVSQYMNHLNPNSEWNPSSGNPDYIFSPKFTYNYSGAGTSYEYDVLKDNGCLPMSLSSFEKYPGNSKFQGASILNSEKSRSWDVGVEGIMLEALKYRLKNYEEIEFTATVGGRLTTSKEGQEILFKVKEALSRGNAVSVCGWSSYWRMGTIDNNGIGTNGKRGDKVIWNGYKNNSGSDGNHAVTLVGYDDDITYTHGGVKMKGAFQMMNSWGNWGSGGFAWVMYDAFNTESEFELFNDPNFYNGSVAFTIDDLKFATGVSTQKNQFTEFHFKGDREINGKTYPTYGLKSDMSKKFLSYSEKGELSNVQEYDEKTCLFALIPYSDLSDDRNEFRKDYVLYAVNCKKYFALNSSVKVKPGPAMNPSASDPLLVCFNIDVSKKDEDGNFKSRISSAARCGEKYERTGTMYRFGFVYWDEDIIYGLPTLSVEAHISLTNRSNLNAVLVRTDKNNVTQKFLPASIRLRQSGTEPDFSIPAHTMVSFSGKYNPEKAEDGYFTFSFDPLCNYGSMSYEDFLWSIELSGAGMVVKSLRLLDSNGKELSRVQLDENAEPFEKGTRRTYSFSFGKELKSYLGAGTYYIKNVGTGKMLSLSANNMTFSWASKNPDIEKVAFRLKYDEEANAYNIWNYKDTFLFDIQGSKLKDGSMVKLNAIRNTRDTQHWILTPNEKGQFTITMKNYPSYGFGYTNQFVVTEKKDSDQFLWEFTAAETEGTLLNTVKTEGGIRAEGTVEKEMKDLQLQVMKDGKVIKTEDLSHDNGVFAKEIKLEAGTYILYITDKEGLTVSSYVICNI